MLIGFHRGIDKYNHMIRIQVHKVGKITILYLLVFIVWKHSVLHVVQCMLGHCLTKAESPTNILNFLDALYPTLDVRPDYVCIDKGCQILRTAISNGSWNVWRETTRFIVDSYHYINHRTSDYLCRKWCNPAPLNGSALNLVVVEHDVNGNPHYKCTFNTQVCLVIRFELTIC